MGRGHTKHLGTRFLFLMFISGCAGSSPLHGLFSHHGDWGLLSSCGARASHCSGLSSPGARALGCRLSSFRLQGTQASVVVAHGLGSCGAQASFSCDTWSLPRPGLNPCLLHWQAGSYPLHHQGRPSLHFHKLVCAFRASLATPAVKNLPTM